MSVLGWAHKSVYRLRQRLVPNYMSENSFSFAMLSHPGRVRKGNEDTCAALPEIGAFVVCDGMGGAAAGEVASRMATEAFLKSLTPSEEELDSPRIATPDVRLDTAIHEANKVVFDQSRKTVHYRGMGTTLVALLLRPAKNGADTALTIAHVGDSRCYLFREGVLSLLTNDHSLVEEQVRLGELTRLEAEFHPMRNIITRAVGSQPDVQPEIRNLDPHPGDLYLLCSDGLTRELSEGDISQTIQRFLIRQNVSKTPEARPDLSTLCQTLIDQANDAGGGDNITVLALTLL